MQTLWLILGSLILPLFWGWAAYRLLAWLWPPIQPLATAGDMLHRPDPLTDYQI
jgi:hypothetical protein